MLEKDKKKVKEKQKKILKRLTKICRCRHNRGILTISPKSPKWFAQMVHKKKRIGE